MTGVQTCATLISGNDKDNYVLGTTATTSVATISQRPLNVTATAHSADKQYNGKTDAPGQAITDDRVVINTVADDVQVTFSASFMDKAAAMNKTVNLSGFTIVSGNDKDNYVLGTTATTSVATISQRPLNVTPTAHSADKQYNQKTDAPGQAITDAQLETNTVAE